MKQLWRRYADRIDAMTLRERLMIFGAVAALLVSFVYSLWIDSDFSRSRRLSAEIAERQAGMNAVQDQIGKLARMREADPDRQNRERLADLQSRLGKVQARISAEERKFTPPERMRAVLEDLLAKNRRVRLVSLNTLPMVSIAEARGAGAPGGAGGTTAPAGERLIYRHGVELVVSGPYLDVLGYLSDLERLPTQLYWSSLAVDSQYPVATMKLTVYTLSLDRAWLNV